MHTFSRRLGRMGLSGDEAKILTSSYKDMVSLPGLRQIVRNRQP